MLKNKIVFDSFTMHFKVFLTILCIGFLIRNADGIFGDKLKKIKEKAKTFYKSKFGKNTTWHFLGHDASEYPGASEEYKKLNKEKWDDYYECLKFQEERLGKHRSVIPESTYVFEGGSAKFQCKICLSPREKDNINSVSWNFAGKDDVGLQELELTENIFVSPDDKTLHLYNLREEHTGEYICRLGQALTAPYFLTVGNNETVDEVHNENAPKGPYPKPPHYMNKYNLLVTTEWSVWSPCSTCGKVGRKHKIGHCFVSLNENANTTLNETSNSTNANLETAHHKVTNLDLEYFHIFKYGIPCKSHILPESIERLHEISSRNSEVMVGFCKEPCPPEKIFEVKDKAGHILETANNTDGIYSMSQQLPPVEPMVERRLQYERKGTTIILSCPGNLNSDSPVKWQIGSKNIIPELILQESNGRIHISLTDKIHIKKAKVHDSNVYSCWQNNELAGTVRLVVERKLKLNFNHHIMLMGLVLILSTFLYVFTRAFFGRKYAKTV